LLRRAGTCLLWRPAELVTFDSVLHHLPVTGLTITASGESTTVTVIGWNVMALSYGRKLVTA
jgi:hypothetical protein